MTTGARRVFLTARWSNLVLLNFPVDAALLEPLLPAGCEIDLWDGRPHVSLVAFQFVDTRVLGVRWPGFTSFPELNLRFYLRHRGQRGVCFVREYVPSRLVAGLARLLYDEPYLAARMSARVATDEHRVSARYALERGAARFEVHVDADRSQAAVPGPDSLEHFFKEHDLGVGRDRAGRPRTYAVEHPPWRVYPVAGCTLRLDAEALYGPRFAFLGAEAPASVVFAEGSQIAVRARAAAG